MLALVGGGCSCGNDGGVPADLYGVGAQCTVATDCLQPDPPCDAAIASCFVQECLLQFKGGYCGITGCVSDAECPLGSACVTHDDGINYCFRICSNKSQCNVNRDPDEEANCSSNVDFVNPNQTAKACVPPSN